MNILILGTGARETALAWKLHQSPLAKKIHTAPGNPQTAEYGTNADVDPMDFAGICKYVTDNAIDLIVSGGEGPLVGGLYDYMEAEAPGVKVLGPSKAGARLEGDKEWAHKFLVRHGIPSSRYNSFDESQEEEAVSYLDELNAPYVLKANGIAGGKGVLIIDDIDDAREVLRDMLGGRYGKASERIVVEEYLEGQECSICVLTDGGGEYRILPVTKDYKRIGEGDSGLNTGGMGAVSPVAFVDEELLDAIDRKIIKPTVQGLIHEGITYRGFITFGVMKTAAGPVVIDLCVRMGDPEAEVMLPRVESDLVRLLWSAAEGMLGDTPLETDHRSAASVMLAVEGYPGNVETGKKVTGLDKVKESLVFQARTATDGDGDIVTAGGRVLAVTSYGPKVRYALATCYESIKEIDFEGKYFRTDIGRDRAK